MRYPGAILAVLLLAAGPCRAGGEAPAAAGTLEGLVGEWVDLRGQISREKRDWKERKTTWEREIGLLDAEKAALDGELSKTDAVVASAESRRQAQGDRQAALQGTLDGLRPLLDRAEAHLRAWPARLPPSLAAGMEKAFRELPGSRKQAEQRAVPRRLQVVIGLYTQLEALQHEFHAGKELLDTGEGTLREVDVFYLGLARGFAVTADNAWAAVGVPTDAGWRWTPRRELAPEVRKALDVSNRTRGAELVSLPLQAKVSQGADGTAGDGAPGAEKAEGGR